MIYSFLLIGQSNMAGRGFLPEAIDVNTKPLYVLRNGRFRRGSRYPQRHGAAVRRA